MAQNWPFSVTSLFANESNMSGQTNWCLYDLVKMFSDYSRSLEIQKVSADEVHKEKVQSKKEKAPKSSLCTAAPSSEAKPGRVTSSRLF